MDTDALTPLCPHCQSVDLDAIFDRCHEKFLMVKMGLDNFDESMYKAADGTYSYVDSIHVLNFDDRLSIESACPLCGFFRSLRVQPGIHKRYKLLAFRSSDTWLYRTDRLRSMDDYLDWKDPVIMAVVPDLHSMSHHGYEIGWLDREIPEVGAIYRRQLHEPSCRESVETEGGKLLCVKEIGETPKFEHIRELLVICRNQHGDACNRRTSDDTVSRGFRLIDCTKNPPTIENKSWGTKYVALSYVWGSKPEDAQDWPATVLDAVEVTKELGSQYLWIDRLCINQSDPSEKSYLISRMTAIYEAADFTIIAAAGSGASHGLPGVRGTRREPQPKYHLNSGSVLLSTLRDPRREILESPYWKRGWTYQEGVLSNRHVVFTDHQTYYECRCMALQESINMVLVVKPQKDEDETTTVMADVHLSGIFKGDSYLGGGRDNQDGMTVFDDQGLLRPHYGFPLPDEVTIRSQLRSLNEHIREFSKRELTRDSDTLLALQGIIGMYKNTKALYMFHGIPMWMNSIAGHTNAAEVTFALSVSTWYHRAGTEGRMFVSEPCNRKTDFPSWSWAGWHGTVSWRAPPNQEHCGYMSDMIQASSLNLLWTPEIFVFNPLQPKRARRLNMHSSIRLRQESPTLIRITDPFVLNHFARIPDLTKEWSWVRMGGRSGREKRIDDFGWDRQWCRIGRRLSFTGMSIPITESEWTANHVSGELISVLLFAGKYLENEHGTARFLTLRKVSTTPELWERVGTLYLTIPFLKDCANNYELFRKIPAEKVRRVFVVQ